MDKENTYVFKQGTSTELARLSRQDEYANKVMGDLLPPSLDPNSVYTALDIGSGTGAWCNDVGASYPHIKVRGIDNSLQMIEYARMQAQTRKLSNVSYQEMNALKLPLAFPDQSFDFINGRFLVSFVPPAEWLNLLRECKRLLKPGGTLRITEGEIGQHNSRAYGQMMNWLVRALDARGLAFGKGFSIGAQGVLNRFFRDADFQSIEAVPYFHELSYGTVYYDIWFEDGILVSQQMKPIVTGQLGVSEEEFENTLMEAIEEMKQPDYCGGGMLLSVSGTTP